jgi:hypothetical protein
MPLDQAKIDNNIAFSRKTSIFLAENSDRSIGPCKKFGFYERKK